MKKRKTIFLLILIIFIVINIGIIIYLKHFQETMPLYYCTILKHTGMYCPACGSTRAVQSLYQLKILKSIYYNPFIIYIYIILIWYITTEAIALIRKKENKLITKKINIYIWIGIVILAVNWTIKLVMQAKGIMMPL